MLIFLQHISISYLYLRLEKKLQVPVMAQQKWERRLNRLKVLRNFSPNHRSNDVIVNEDREQLLSARFSYGPLDFVLAGEHIDIFVAKDTAQTEVCFFLISINQIDLCHSYSLIFVVKAGLFIYLKKK